MTQFFNRTSERAKRRKLRRAMPRAEVLVWSRIRNEQLGCRFRRQYSIGAFLIDFYCPRLKLGIELDGECHYEPGAAEYDAQRQEFIERFGVRMLRFTNEDVFSNLDGIVEMIRREAIGRMDAASDCTLRPPPTPPS